MAIDADVVPVVLLLLVLVSAGQKKGRFQLWPRPTARTGE